MRCFGGSQIPQHLLKLKSASQTSAVLSTGPALAKLLSLYGRAIWLSCFFQEIRKTFIGYVSEDCAFCIKWFLFYSPCKLNKTTTTHSLRCTNFFPARKHSLTVATQCFVVTVSLCEMSNTMSM